MRVGTLEVPTFPMDIYTVREKSGSRKEYSVTMSENLKQLASQISSMPLRYASIVHAFPGEDQDQDFHKDSDSGERAIVYLTDVMEETNGPIEFLDHGKLLGKAGSYVHYPASEVHRGCKSDIDRYALALAFDMDDSKAITTIGAVCSGFVCDSGYVLKDPIVNTGDPTNANCCKKTKKDFNWLLIVVPCLFLLFFVFLRAKQA
jgi:hypothetical protein